MLPSARRVLLVDAGQADDAAAAEIADLLERAGFAVRVAEAAEEPGAVAARSRPHLDMVSAGEGQWTPVLTGALVSELERDHGVPVMVLVPKPVDGGPPAPVALDDLATVLRHHEPLPSPSPTLAAGDLVVDEAGRLALRADQPLDLTRLEFDLLAYFVRHRNKVLSRQALLASVWRNEPVTPNAVEALVSKLRAKLDAHGPRLIHTVRGVGYVLRIPGTSPFDARRDALVARRERLVREREDMLARRTEVRRSRADDGT
jgi:DNA-binding response OmpR family regulator